MAVRGLDRFTQGVDSINELGLKLVTPLVGVITILAVIEVILRYVFNSPTSWVWIVNSFLLLALVAIAGANSYHQGYFVVSDVFYRRFPPRIRVIVDLVSLACLFVFCIVLISEGVQQFWRSFVIREVTTEAIRFPIYPFKLLAPIGGFMVLMQGVSKLFSVLQRTNVKE